MDRAVDVALISSFALLLLAKLLSVPVEIGVPAALAAAIANGARVLREMPVPIAEKRRTGQN